MYSDVFRDYFYRDERFLLSFAVIGLILVSPDMFIRYGLLPSQAPIALNNPGIISIPLSFLTLVVVSLFTQKAEAKQREKSKRT